MVATRFDAFARALAAHMSRRRTLLTIASVGSLGVLPAALMALPVAAFKSFSSCKKHCNRFDGQCQHDCVTCCRKTVKGNQQRCNFGCGVIRGKKK